MTADDISVKSQRKRRRKPSDLPPLIIPEQSDFNKVLLNSPQKIPHPHIWGPSQEEKLNVQELVRDGKLQRAHQDKMHYVDKNHMRFVKVFMDEDACKSERELTDKSSQYSNTKKTKITSSKHETTGLWFLELPFLSKDKWKTLEEYKSKEMEDLADDAPAGSFVRAFWKAADKLISKGLIHLDLVHNAMHNIMVRTSNNHLVEEVKIVDYGMCRVDENASDWIDSYYNMILHNVLENLYHIYL